MSREIKFRVWDETKKQMVYSDHEGGLRQFFDYTDNPNEITGEMKFMEFIGLEDKNEKEIYEGDVIKFSDKLHGYISFKEGKFIILYIEKNLPKKEQDCGTHLNYYEVVGNAYETPELLK